MGRRFKKHRRVRYSSTSESIVKGKAAASQPTSHLQATNIVICIMLCWLPRVPRA